MPPAPSSFGAQLRRFRERAGLTQADLAERAGLTAQAISALERGARRQPYPHTIQALAAALGLSPEERAALIGARATSAPAATPAPPTATPAAGHNLPAQVSSFIGRAAEIQELEGLLRQHRLVTLTGAGGSGKTRLALAAADAVAPAFPGEVRLVELAGFSDPAFLADAVARALGLHEAPGADAAELILAHLRQRHALLLLDNCEHLIDACAALADRLLRGCPRLHICATSREVLRLPGERVYLVPTLPAPNPDALAGAEELALYDAVRLFEERAAAQLPGFRLTAANAQAVATICWRLDGIPLAIELAAARVRSIPPQQLAERLGQSLRLLTGGSRSAPARQQTLRGTLDWSYDLLEPAERELFRRLSVFAGGWELEAADLVGASFGGGPPVADLLAQLVDQSLVQAEPTGPAGATRYRMLEPVRQYALQLLEESGELHAIRSRHAAIYLDLAERAQPELRRAGQVAWIERLSLEHDNIRAALAWALRAGEVEVAARIGWCLWPFWWMRAYQAEGRRWMEQILAHEGRLSPWLRARALMALATMGYGQGDIAFVDRTVGSLTAYVEAGDPSDGHARGFTLMARGLLAIGAGQLGEALELLEGCIPLLEAHAEHGIAAQMRVFQGTALLLLGDLAGAEGRFSAGLAVASQLGDRLSIGNALFSLAQLALARADYDGADRHLRAGVPIAHAMGDPAGLAFIIEGLALVAAGRGDDRGAARRLGAAEALRERIGLRGHTYYGPYRPLYERANAELRDRMGPAELEAAWAAGRGLTVAEALDG